MKADVTSSSSDSYRQQLTRCARSLAVGHVDGVRGELRRGITAMHVRLFTDGNLDKRLEKLLAQTELLHEDFAGMESLVRQYIHAVPSEAYDCGASDCERFLTWLAATQSPTPEQRDLIECLQGRHQIEALARDLRVAYIHFHDLRSLAARQEREPGRDFVVRLNPIRVWGTFRTSRLIDETAEPPADVLFYALDGDVRTAVLEPPGKSLVERLEKIEPCTIESWSVAGGVDREDVVELADDLAELGLLVAI